MKSTARAAEWLASGDLQPSHAHVWWASRGLALMPAGRIWDAIKVSSDHLAEIAGPVMCDPAIGTLYYLVPVGTAAAWSLDGTAALGEGAWVSVPSPARTAAPGPHWLRLPDGQGTLTDPATLRQALLGQAATEARRP